MMLKMLVFSATYHIIDLFASKLKCYPEGGLKGLTFNRKTVTPFDVLT